MATVDKQTLVQNYKTSNRQLEAAGYRKISAVMAGGGSKSVYRHPETGQIAEIAVANANLVAFR